MREGIKWTVAIGCAVIAIAGMALLLKGVDGEIGDTTYSYLYKGSTIVDDPCPVVSNLQESFGDYVIANEGVTVNQVCGKYVVKVGFYNTTNQDLGYDWLNKTPIYGWSTLMLVILWIAFIGGFIGSVASVTLL